MQKYLPNNFYWVFFNYKVIINLIKIIIHKCHIGIIPTTHTLIPIHIGKPYKDLDTHIMIHTIPHIMMLFEDQELKPILPNQD